MATLYRILRPFRAAGEMRNPTDAPVDGALFRNLKQLVEQRYLAATDDIIPGNAGGSPVPDPKVAQDAAKEEEAGRTIEPGKNVGDEQAPAGGDAAGKSESAAGDSEVKEALPTGDEDPLPEDFPGFAKLEAADIDTWGEVREALEAGTLLDIEGIGPKTADDIKEAVDAAGKSEGDAE